MEESTKEEKIEKIKVVLSAMYRLLKSETRSIKKRTVYASLVEEAEELLKGI